jgi:hypothetical protein
MAMGKRRRHAKQALMWVASHDLPRSAGHPFYACHQILAQHSFDGYVEELCERLRRRWSARVAGERPRHVANLTCGALVD